MVFEGSILGSVQKIRAIPTYTAVREITAGQRTISGQLHQVSGLN